MSESLPNNESVSEASYDEFLDAIESDNWDTAVDKGIPLYAELKKKSDMERAREVRDMLEGLLSTLKNSGAGSDEYRKGLQDRIETAFS